MISLWIPPIVKGEELDVENCRKIIFLCCDHLFNLHSRDELFPFFFLLFNSSCNASKSWLFSVFEKWFISRGGPVDFSTQLNS